jgi:hypothetical protein
MADEPINLAKARAEKANDSRLWTPIDALKDVISEIEAGKIKADQIAIHWRETNEDGSCDFCYCVAGLTFSDHIALLHAALARVLELWRKG